MISQQVSPPTGTALRSMSIPLVCAEPQKSRGYMHTQVLDDSRPVVVVMKRLGLGSVCSGVECDAL